MSADYAAETAALDRRGRRLKAVAGWIGFVGLLLVSAMADFRPINHLAPAGFGPMLHVPASIAPTLRAVGLTVQDAAGWTLATDDDHSGSSALLMLKLSCVVVFFVGLLRRQWALAVVALAVWFTPSGPFFHKPTPGEALMTSAAPLVGHPMVAPSNADHQQAVVIGPLSALNIERFHRIGEPKPFAQSEQPVVAPTSPAVVRVRLSLDSVPPAQRPDMAYLLAQAAFKDDDPQQVATFYAAMGGNYPQTDRITRDRIRALADYLTAHNALPDEPKPASPWSFEIKQTANGDLALLVRLFLLAALLTEITGGLIRRRAKRIGGQLTNLRPMAA